jgi:hypothetical protein
LGGGHGSPARGDPSTVVDVITVPPVSARYWVRNAWASATTNELVARDTSSGKVPCAGPVAVAPTQLTCHRIAYVALT